MHLRPYHLLPVEGLTRVLSDVPDTAKVALLGANHRLAGEPGDHPAGRQGAEGVAESVADLEDVNYWLN